MHKYTFEGVEYDIKATYDTITIEAETKEQAKEMLQNAPYVDITEKEGSDLIVTVTNVMYDDVMIVE